MSKYIALIIDNLNHDVISQRAFKPLRDALTGYWRSTGPVSGNNIETGRKASFFMRTFRPDFIDDGCAERAGHC